MTDSDHRPEGGRQEHDMTTTLAILGVADPEMAAIEKELRRHISVMVAYATINGRRCHPGNVYDANGVVDVHGIDISADVDSFERILMVECNVMLAAGDPERRVIICDHHRPGDPGFGKPPEGFLAASSLGQVLALLHLRPTPAQRLIAAADHCLGAAYASQCPGVDPMILRDHRAKQRAAWLAGLPTDRPEVRAVCAHGLRLSAEEAGLVSTEDAWVWAVGLTWRASAHELVTRPLVDLGGVQVRDLRAEVLPEAQEVLAQAGAAGLYRRTDPRSGIDKLGILGAGTGTVPGTVPVEAFMDAARSGSVCGTAVDAGSVYGDPVRGFAGATVAT